MPQSRKRKGAKRQKQSQPRRNVARLAMSSRSSSEGLEELFEDAAQYGDNPDRFTQLANQVASEYASYFRELAKQNNVELIVIQDGPTGFLMFGTSIEKYIQQVQNPNNFGVQTIKSLIPQQNQIKAVGGFSPILLITDRFANCTGYLISSTEDKIKVAENFI